MASNENLAQAEDDPIDPSLLRALAGEAAVALADLWDSPRKSFWRSTEHRAAEEGKQPAGLFPTVTFRSLEALLRLIEDYSEWAQPQIVREAVPAAISAILSKTEAELQSQSSLGISNEEGILNPFTLSLYIDCLARIGRCRTIEENVSGAAAESLTVACQHLLSYSESLRTSQGGADVHPFVLFHIARAIELGTRQLRNESVKEGLEQFRHSLVETARSQLKALLAQDSLGAINPGEGVAASFCAAVLAMDRDPEQAPFVNAALRVAFKFQDSSGCWPLGRIVPVNKDTEIKRDLQMPTYEIAWGLTEAVLSILESSRGFLVDGTTKEAFSKLKNATKYIATSAVQLDHGSRPIRGWCSEHAFGKPIVESWTSATVLHAILSFQELAEAVSRRVTLQQFTTANPKDADWPQWQRWETYTVQSEPEDNVKILKYLDRKIVQSIRIDPSGLPRSRDNNVSMLVFGPPGTAKTTLVRALADGLKWPVVFLSPGNFIERGLEYIEAQARSVFEMLHRLSKVVVLFDECDELFRDRKPSPATDQVRNITAFVTASMLPKLQDLHDRGRVVFAVCTNHIESIDPAIRRGGRIDHIIGIGPPDKIARRRIMEEVWAKKPNILHASEAMDELVRETERFTRGEIERAATRIVGTIFTSSEDARNHARTVAEGMRGSLTISEREFESFNRLKLEYSHPHQEGA